VNQIRLYGFCEKGQGNSHQLPKTAGVIGQICSKPDTRRSASSVTKRLANVRDAFVKAVGQRPQLFASRHSGCSAR